MSRELRPASFITLKQIPYTGIGDTLKAWLFIAAVIGLSGFAAKKILELKENHNYLFILSPSERRRLKIIDQEKLIAKYLVRETITEDIWLPTAALKLIASLSDGDETKAKELLKGMVQKGRKLYPDQFRVGLVSEKTAETLLGLCA